MRLDFKWHVSFDSQLQPPVRPAQFFLLEHTLRYVVCTSGPTLMWTARDLDCSHIKLLCSTSRCAKADDKISISGRLSMTTSWCLGTAWLRPTMCWEF